MRWALRISHITEVYIRYEGSYGAALETTVNMTFTSFLIQKLICDRSDALVAARFVRMRDSVSADKESEQNTSLTGQSKAPAISKPTLPPFIWSHELARGGMQILQSFFGYALMLAVM
jgi:hypothetical protein